MKVQLDRTSILFEANGIESQKQSLADSGFISINVDGVDDLNAVISGSVPIPGMSVSIDKVPVQKYNVGTDYEITTYNVKSIHITVPENTSEEPIQQKPVKIQFTGKAIFLDPATELYTLIPAGTDVQTIEVTQSAKELQIDDVDTGAAEDEGSCSMDDYASGNNAGFVFELVLGVAMPGIVELISQVKSMVTTEVESLTKDISETIKEIKDELLSIDDMLKQKDLTETKRQRLLKKKEKLEKQIQDLQQELTDKVNDLKERAQQLQQQVQDQVKGIVEGKGNLGIEIKNHLKNIKDQSAIVIKAIPKLVVNAGTAIIEPMTAITACAVGPCVTATNPGQILGTLTRLGQQATALKEPISSLKQSAEFLQFNGDVGKKYGLDKVLKPIEIVEKGINTIAKLTGN
jgi:Skp family chaperone for outer membrane proteins